MNDPIVDEVRRIREAHAARFNHDLDAIFRDIKEQEKRSGRKFVSFARDGSVIQPSAEVGAEKEMALPPNATAGPVPTNVPAQQFGPAGS